MIRLRFAGPTGLIATRQGGFLLDAHAAQLLAAGIAIGFQVIGYLIMKKIVTIEI